MKLTSLFHKKIFATTSDTFVFSLEDKLFRKCIDTVGNPTKELPVAERILLVELLRINR